MTPPAKAYSPIEVLVRLLLMSKKYSAWFIFLCVVALLHSGVSLLIVEVYKRMVNSAIQMNVVQLLDTLKLAGVIIVSLVVLNFINVYVSGQLHNRSTLRLQSFYLNKVLRLRWSEINLFHSSDLINRISESTDEAQSAINEKLIKILGDITLVCFMIIYLVFISWKVTLGLAIISLLIPILLSKVSHQLRQIYDKQQQIRSDRDSVIQNAIQGAEIVRSLSIHKKIEAVYTDIYKRVIEYSKKALILEGIIRQVNYIIPFICLVFVLGYGGYLSIHGAMDLGSLVAFVVAIDWIINPLTGLANSWVDFQKAISNGKRIFDLEKLSNEDDLSNSSSSEVLTKNSNYFIGDYEICFKNVSYGYNSDRNVIENIDFFIKSGTITGIIGESGCGKSTLLKMCSRLLEPSQGKITYNNMDISEIPVDLWRSSIAYISQNTFLFTGTIFENIRIGKYEASDEEVIEAAKKANIHEVIMEKENGYYTSIGNNGSIFSGGERQRLSLARAFLKNPDLLILDEPTASLDKVNEEIIMDSLNVLMRGKTVIVVTHDLSIIENANYIWSFSDGVLRNIRGESEYSG